MPGSEQPIDVLMERICAGSDDAVRELLDAYGPALLQVIRRRLSQRLRSRFDSTDFTQAVWTSFFAVPLHTYRFKSPKALLAFLTELASNKVHDATRQRLETHKRNPACEQPLGRL